MTEKAQIATREDADAFLVGLALLSTGGGGVAARGRQYLYEMLDEGLVATWVPIEGLPDDTMTCSPFGMGSVAPHPAMSPTEMAAFGVNGQVVERPAVRAVQELGKVLLDRPGAIVPFELGGFNTVVAIDAATRLGLPLVDGDYIGRALPEMNQALPCVLDLPLWPLTVCDQWGNSLVLQDCPSPAVAERIGKMISTVTKAPDMLATCAHAAFPIRIGAVKASSALVDGTLTRALRVGRAVLQAREAGGDPVLDTVDQLDGELLFRGTVIQFDWTDRDGYMTGFSHLEGDSSYQGSSAKVWFKNENHVVWRDDTVLAMSPDCIAVVRDDTAEPLTNTEIRKGDRVAVIGSRGADQYRTGSALELTQPRHYGFDLDYAPIEQLVGRSDRR